MNTMRPHAPLQVQQINEFSGGERAWSSAIQTAHSRTWPDMIPNYFVENYTPEFDLTCSLDDRELDVILNVPSIPSQAETHHVDGFLDRSNAAVSPGPYVDTTRSCFPPLMNHHGGYGCLPLPPMRAAIDNDTFGSSTSTYALHPRSTVTTMNAAAGSSVALGMDMATPAIPSEVHRPPVRQQQTETTQILDFTKNRNDEREAKESYKRVSIHSTKACAVLHLHSRDPFYHVVKYNYGPKDKWGTVVYGCVSHQKCGHRVRVTSFKSFDVADKIVFAVEEKGKHSEIMSNRKRIGIHPMVKAEIDAMLAAGGSGPSGILTRLVLKYKHEGMREFRERLPKAAKIKNRRSYLSERLGLDWKIKSLVDLNEWCTPRVCDTAEKFFGPAGFDRSTDSATFAAASFSFRSDLLVLGSFRHDFVQDGVAKESFGVVMTSRQIFRNVLYAAEGQGNDGVFAAADGTYKLHYGGWTLVVFGTYQTRYTTRKYQKHFVPWAYLFVRTEHQVAYEHLFRSVVRCADEWFNVQLKVTYGSLDHAACIANAFQAVWPEILLLDCYAHVARKCRNSKKLRDPDFYKDNVKINVVQMHIARSTAQFDALTALILAFWRSSGESEYADWFSEIYLHERWKNWYTTCAMPGIQPNQNALESHNKSIKMKRRSDSIICHFCEGPLTSYMVARAVLHVEEDSHYIKRRRDGHKMVIRSVLFNASKYMQTPSGHPPVPVTTERVERYLSSKLGQLSDEDTVLDIDLHYLSLHEVEFLYSTKMNFKLELEPVISSDTITKLRAMYQCDCKQFWCTGWICSHVIAVLALMKQFSLADATAILPIVKASGGQRKIPGALYNDDPKNKTLSKENLLKRLQRDPLFPRHWTITKEFTFKDDETGSEDVEMVAGVIDRWRPNGGRYKWGVKFDDDERLYFELEELVDLIVMSRRLGLDVTNSSQP
ncbi:hypothetical protein PR002_g9547 [Phytophthora rubi]|uniref:SWIM-type domain-containing protein n=1 Tax=Phytophthora rubi TaxID=129364 RepID=A0A6A3MQD3_9STRA|nr:hypothetical protein PR002_g9547 [Phytophthora rubi]